MGKKLAKVFRDNGIETVHDVWLQWEVCEDVQCRTNEEKLCMMMDLVKDAGLHLIIGRIQEGTHTGDCFETVGWKRHQHWL